MSDMRSNKHKLCFLENIFLHQFRKKCQISEYCDISYKTFYVDVNKSRNISRIYG